MLNLTLLKKIKKIDIIIINIDFFPAIVNSNYCACVSKPRPEMTLVRVPLLLELRDAVVKDFPLYSCDDTTCGKTRKCFIRIQGVPVSTELPECDTWAG